MNPLKTNQSTINMDQKFDLKYQYKLYLQRMGLKEENLHPVQKEQLEQAFFGACSQMLFLFRDEVGRIESEEEAVNTMKNMIDQASAFWLDVMFKIKQQSNKPQYKPNPNIN